VDVIDVIEDLVHSHLQRLQLLDTVSLQRQSGRSGAIDWQSLVVQPSAAGTARLEILTIVGELDIDVYLGQDSRADLPSTDRDVLISEWQRQELLEILDILAKGHVTETIWRDGDVTLRSEAKGMLDGEEVLNLRHVHGRIGPRKSETPITYSYTPWIAAD
jgi:hypothetical protein